MNKHSGEIVLLGLGSNLGDSRANILAAIEKLNEAGFQVLKISSFYKTNPVGNPNQPDFLNIVISGSTLLTPHELLSRCKEIEKSMGRIMNQPRWTARPIDIDIIFYGKRIVQSHELIVPHTQFGERLFVLIPALEVEPDFMLPNGSSLSDFFERRKSVFNFSDQAIEKI